MYTRQELVLKFMLAFAANSHITKSVQEYGDHMNIAVLAGEWADAYLASLA